MSMLTEKREELSKKLDSLLNERLARINDKIIAYKEQLMAEEPLGEEIINTKKIIDALDEIIKYDTQEEVKEVKPEVEVQPIEAEPVIVEPVVEAEPIIEEAHDENVVIGTIDSVTPCEPNVVNIDGIEVEPVKLPEPEFIEEVPTEEVPADATIIPCVEFVESRPGMPTIEIPNRG